MKRALFLALILAVFLSARGQKTEIQYLSGLNKDHMVQWEFFCNNGMNSGKWSKIGVPSNWELQGFGSYLYGKVNKEITNADFINTSSQFQKSGRRNVFILFLKGQ